MVLREETYTVLAYQVPLTISFPITLIVPTFWGCKGKNILIDSKRLSAFFFAKYCTGNEKIGFCKKIQVSQSKNLPLQPKQKYRDKSA
jgi:hypothetical protein